MITLEYILIGVAVGVAQAAIILIAWGRGYNVAMRDAKKRIANMIRNPVFQDDKK